MSLLKVAILEDSKLLLKELKKDLELTGLVEVIAFASTSEEFLSKVSSNIPEAILLDIDLSGDSMNGLDIANRLGLPVLFLSGKTRDFYEGIEAININSNIPVDHITKPITLEKLNKFLPKFISEIRSQNKANFIYLDFGGTKRNKISSENIVFLCADKEAGSLSNNKLIYFNNHKPELLVNFTLDKMESFGFDKNKFIKIHKSFRVNIDAFSCYNKVRHEIEVEAVNFSGKKEKMLLPVSENYRNEILRVHK